jgi:hypothetical protein
MDRRNHANGSRRRMALVFEGLEVREVPSSASLIAASGGLSLTHASSGISSAQLASTPTPHELAREQFSARFKGPFVTGLPRFTDQISQTYLYGGGISSAFLHGDLQLAFSIPKDPTQPITGQATMTVKNVSNTGNQLILDLQADPGSLDQAGRPTRFTWTQNPASGGIFTNGSGSGTAQIQYTPGRRRPLRSFSAGTAGVLFQGTLFTTNLTNTLRNQ